MGRASFAEEASAPGTPSAGFVTLYFLATGSGIPLVKDDAGVVQTVAMLEAFNVFTVSQKIDVSSGTAFVVEDDGVNDDILVVNTSNSRVGVGEGSPSATLHVTIGGGTVPGLFGEGIIVQNNSITTDQARIRLIAGTAAIANIDFGDSGSSVSGGISYDNNTDELSFRTNSVSDRMLIDSSGNVGVSVTAPSGRLHIDNPSAAQPVLFLDQGDVSEEMIQYASTIGVGNAIEAKGAKSLTVTHFIKITIPGPLTRYHAVGTIA